MELRLPSEYQEVEYIENTGTQYIITDLLFPKELESPKIEWGFMQIAVPSGDNMIFGYWSNGSIYYEVYNSTTLSYASIGKNHYDRISNSNLTKDMFIAGVMTKETMYLNGYSYATNAEDTIDQSVRPMAIFAWNSSSGRTYTNKGARIYYLRFFDGNTKMADYVPCYRKSDGEIGMYDTVTKTFYTNSGTGTFLKGADITRYIDNVSVLDTRRKILLNTPHIDTSVGDLATFNTDLRAPLKSCKVSFLPVQEGEGDPSPENIREITGWSGVEIIQTNQNLIRADDPNNPTLNYHPRSSYNYVVYSEEEQAFTERDTIEHVGGGINEANHARINATKNDQARLFIAPKDGIYTFTCDYKNVGTNYGLRFYKIIDGVSTRLGDIHGDADGLWHTRSFTVELNKGDSFRLYIYSNIYWRNFRIIEGDGTDYTENVTNDYSISWTDSVGTVYGGYIDLVSGELVQTWYGFTLDGVNNYLNSGSQLLNNGLATIYDYIGSGGLNNLPKGPVNTYTGAIICNKFPLAYNRENEGITTGSGSLYIRLLLDPSKLGDVSSTSAIRESMIKWQQENPLQIVYKLAEPIHYQLTPQQILTLKGINNVYSDTNGQMEIKYWKH